MAVKDTIVIHHSLTEDGDTVSWQAIRHYHTKVQGWREIGYHFGVEWVKDFGHIPGHFEVFVGRMFYEDAAACYQQGMNRRGIHICAVGNFDQQEPPYPQWLRTAQLAASICASMGISPDRVFGHRDFAPKSCPGTRWDMEAFRGEVRAIVKEINS